jgi:ATP-dependent RNA helicase DHX29
VLVLDGNRARFALPDWKSALVVKTLRARLRDLLTRCFRYPGRPLTPQHERWLDAWQRVFALAQEARERAAAAAAVSAAAATVTVVEGGTWER